MTENLNIIYIWLLLVNSESFLYASHVNYTSSQLYSYFILNCSKFLGLFRDCENLFLAFVTKKKLFKYFHFSNKNFQNSQIVDRIGLSGSSLSCSYNAQSILHNIRFHRNYLIYWMPIIRCKILSSYHNHLVIIKRRTRSLNMVLKNWNNQECEDVVLTINI